MATGKSKTPAILAGCGCASLILSIVLFTAAWWIGTRDGVAATDADLVQYRNTAEGRTGALAENYVAFELAYPKSWIVKDDPENFVTIERNVESKTWENLNVGYFQTAGSRATNETLYASLVASLQNQFAQQFPGLRKVDEGKTKVGPYDAYEGLFESTANVDGNPVEIYMRVVLLPTPDGDQGVTLLMMGTSFHPELQQPDDLGRKGELPLVLESFRFID